MPDSAKDLDIRPASQLTSDPGSESEPGPSGGRKGERGERTAPAASEVTNVAGAQESHVGRPDQEIRHNVNTGAGGATDWGPAVSDHPQRRISRPGPN